MNVSLTSKKSFIPYVTFHGVLLIRMWVSYLSLILPMSWDTRRVQWGCVSLTYLTLIYTMSRDTRRV
jgi:hypothetical protein